MEVNVGKILKGKTQNPCYNLVRMPVYKRNKKAYMFMAHKCGKVQVF
jgi:hypothetical protein